MKLNKHIAVIGIGGVFPEAEDLNSFLQNLRQGKDSVRVPTRERIHYSTMDTTREYQPLAFLDRVDLFDHSFFGLSKKDASYIDPAQRFLLQQAVVTIENAGYRLEAFRGSKTGVFLGMRPGSYEQLLNSSDAAAITGTLLSMASGRISYNLDLHGPSLVFDTACSSSLVAIHEACKSLNAGECEYALAGGFRIASVFAGANGVDGLGIHSPDGKNRSFDDEANGTGTGEGGGLVLLKSLDKALADKDVIHAVILGSATNSDGARSNGITAPSPLAQEEVIRQAWEMAAIDPQTISYIETHGTGTKLGDPIEVQAIRKAFEFYTDKKQFCALGALKSNIGHLDNAAGIAGFIKAVISLKKKQLFPVVHYQKPNRFIDFSQSAAFVTQQLKEWAPRDMNPARCGVSSFGLSGTNAHIVLQEAPVAPAYDYNEKWVLKISAKTAASLQAMTAKLLSFFKDPAINISQACYTLNVGRSDYKYRLGLTATDYSDLIQKLENLHSQNEYAAVAGKEIILLLSGLPFGDDIHEQLCKTFKVYSETAAAAAHQIGSKTENHKAFIYSYALLKQVQSMGVNIKMIIGTGIGQQVNEALTRGSISDQTKWAIDNFQPTEPNKQKLQNWLQTIDPEKYIFLTAGGNNVLYELVSAFSPLINIIHLSKSPGKVDLHQLIADLYTQGSDIDWMQLYGGEKRQKIEAPFYSFDQVRCWYKEPEIIDPSNWIYKLSWIQKDAVADEPLSGNSYLLFTDGSGLDEIVARRMEAEGKTIIKVSHGNSFLRLSDKHFEINRFRPDDYVKLKEAVVGISGVIHFDVCAHVLNPNEPVRDIEERLYPYFYFNKVFSPLFSTKGFSVFIITANGSLVKNDDPLVNPYAHAVISLQKALLSEFPGLNLQAVDLSLADSLPDQGECVLTQMANSDHIRFSAYRNAKRYIPQINKLTVNRPELTQQTKEKVCLITGGASGLGLEVSKHLSASQAKTLIILGRSPVKERLHALKAIEQSGTEVCYYQADVGDAAAMSVVFDEISKKINRIDAVIHCAVGQVRFDASADITMDTLKTSFNEKILGTVVLDELTRPFKPELFVLFSSLHAQVPHKNGGEYAVANGFLDGYALGRQQEGKSFISINWPGWNGAGQSANVKENLVLKKIDLQEGMLALDYAMQLKQPIIQVANVKLENFAVNPFFIVSNGTMTPEGPLARNKVPGQVVRDEPLSVEEVIAGIWKEVLMADNIKSTDDFFELGGHSLNGAQVLNRIEKVYNVPLDLDDIFEYGTVQQLAARVKTLIEETKKIDSVNAIAEAPVNEYYELSHSQKRIWLSSQTSEGNMAYNIPSAYLLKGKLNVAAFEQSFHKLIQRHEILRTVFITVQGEPKQKILPVEEIKFQLHYETGVEDDVTEAYLEHRISSEAKQIVNLETGPLLRATLIRLSEDEFFFIFNIHHIICDGWSLELLFKELITHYQGAGERIPELPPLKLQYKDYAAWQHERINNGLMSQSRLYWQTKLAGTLPPTQIPADFARSDKQTFEGDVVNFSLQSDLVNNIRAAALATNTTTFVFMLSVFKTLIFACSQQNDLLLGTDFAGRINEQTEGMIGMFINPMVLRTHLSPNMSFVDFTATVKQTFLEAIRHQEYQFDQIVADVVKHRDMSRNPLFDMMFVMLNMQQMNAAFQLPDFEMKAYGKEPVMSQFDLSLVAADDKVRINYFIKYNIALYRRSTIDLLGAQYEFLLKKVVDEVATPIYELCNALDTFTKEYKRSKQLEARSRNLQHLRKFN